MSSGNLYQLKTRALTGEYVVIGGPYDTYGKVVALRPETGYHLIRGLGHSKPEGVSSFISTKSIP